MQSFTLPRLALSVHLLGLTQGTFLIVMGMLWPRLHLTRSQSTLGHVLALYGAGAAWLANLAGAIWGAGSKMVPLAAGKATGTQAQEFIIAWGLRSAALSFLFFAAFLIWALSTSARRVVT